MTTIGGKQRKAKLPSRPQVIVRRSIYANEYALFGINERNEATLVWIGDPNSASKFNSKFEAKERVRDIQDVPETRIFMTI